MNLRNTSTLRSHWFWFTILLSAYSVHDYFGHILRAGSIFEQEPIKWLLFTLSSHTTFLLISFGTAKLLGNLKIPELVAAVLGVATAAALHITVFGPLWDKVFWDGGLLFASVLYPTGIACLLYLSYRGIYYLVQRSLSHFAT